MRNILQGSSFNNQFKFLMKYTVKIKSSFIFFHLKYTLILLPSIVFEIKAKEDHRHDLSVSIELLSAYTIAKSISSEEVNLSYNTGH